MSEFKVFWCIRGETRTPPSEAFEKPVHWNTGGGREFPLREVSIRGILAVLDYGSTQNTRQSRLPEVMMQV